MTMLTPLLSKLFRPEIRRAANPCPYGIGCKMPFPELVPIQMPFPELVPIQKW
jgi:hypothetical protein